MFVSDENRAVVVAGIPGRVTAGATTKAIGLATLGNGRDTSR
jgi:hypothetical protein